MAGRKFEINTSYIYPAPWYGHGIGQNYLKKDQDHVMMKHLLSAYMIKVGKIASYPHECKYLRIVLFIQNPE